MRSSPYGEDGVASSIHGQLDGHLSVRAVLRIAPIAADLRFGAVRDKGREAIACDVRRPPLTRAVPDRTPHDCCRGDGEPTASVTREAAWAMAAGSRPQ